MNKILHVVEPFFDMEVNDTFELNDDGTAYVSKRTEEFHKSDCDNINSIDASYSTTFSISTDTARDLINDGYLKPGGKDDKFVNIFDEIDNLSLKYTKDLANLDNDYKDAPACLKIEKQTVLANLIEVLNHLKSLKK